MSRINRFSPARVAYLSILFYRNSMLTLLFLISPFILYDAGEYPQAVEAFQEYVPDSTWTEVVKQYDVGTALLQSKQYQESINVFQGIAYKGNSSPGLGVNLRTNMAIADIQLALQETDQERKLYFIRAALSDINTAQELDCKLYQLEGGRECPKRQILTDIEGYAKQMLSQELEKVTLNPSKQVSHLIVWVKDRLNQIDLLEKAPQPQRQAYQDAFLQKNVLTWNTEILHPEALKIFDQVHQSYAKGMDQLKEGQWNEARKSFKEALKDLRVLFPLVSESSEYLEELLEQYNENLSYSPLEYSELIKLKEQQDELYKTIPGLEKAVQNLDDSIKEKNQAKARVYLMEARYEVEALAPRENDPESILKAALRAQEEALEIRRLETDLTSIMQNAQKRVVDLLGPFLKIVYEQQVAFYPLKGCQCVPWNTVLPLFLKGQTAAQEALKASNMIPLQEQAYTYIKKALEELRKDHPPQPQAQPIDNLLQNLEEMQNQDVKKTKQQAAPIQGIKPW